jgi:hypothetical protein
LLLPFVFALAAKGIITLMRVRWDAAENSDESKVNPFAFLFFLSQKLA